MPVLGLTQLNIVLSILGAFFAINALVSVKLKQVWYLGEALPAMLMGIAVGPIAANFLNSEKWGSAEEGQTNEITLGITGVVIGVQLVIAGYQFPARYPWTRLKEIFICLIPVMALMWLLTTACYMATIPKISLLAALVIGATVTCTDPVLSQAVAKGPFSDKFVARPLREIISAEAGLNDGFGFPFLMLAVYLLRHANGGPESFDIPAQAANSRHRLIIGAEQVGRIGGGLHVAMQKWLLETWLYFVVLGCLYGAVVGYIAGKAIAFAQRRKWIDAESYVLFPAALGLFIIGTCGAVGLDDLLACTVSGAFLNWDGEFLAETERRHDEVNSCIDVLLNFGGFMYIGSVINWADFHDPDGTGITIWRLLLLGVMVLFLRRIPAILALYKLMPRAVDNWKEALFMGYFGPIGIGAVFYVEHTRHLIPILGEGDPEYEDLLRALTPTVYFLVVFSIVVHGLSIPALDFIYRKAGVEHIQEDPVNVRRCSESTATPPNAVYNEGDDNFTVYNRFSRPTSMAAHGSLDALAALETGNRPSRVSWADDTGSKQGDRPRSVPPQV